METRLIVEQIHHVRVLLEEVSESLPEGRPGDKFDDAYWELRHAINATGEAAGILEVGEEEE